jgi:hypothetical protein
MFVSVPWALDTQQMAHSLAARAAAAAAAATADKNPVLKEFATEVTKVINEAVAALEGQQ